MTFPLPGTFFSLPYPKEKYLLILRIEFSCNFFWEVFPDLLRARQHLDLHQGAHTPWSYDCPLPCMSALLDVSLRREVYFIPVVAPAPAAATGTESFHEYEWNQDKCREKQNQQHKTQGDENPNNTVKVGNGHPNSCGGPGSKLRLRERWQETWNRCWWARVKSGMLQCKSGQGKRISLTCLQDWHGVTAQVRVNKPIIEGRPGTLVSKVRASTMCTNGPCNVHTPSSTNHCQQSVDSSTNACLLKNLLSGNPSMCTFFFVCWWGAALGEMMSVRSYHSLSFLHLIIPGGPQFIQRQ